MKQFALFLTVLCILTGCSGDPSQARADYQTAMNYLQGVGAAKDEAKGIEFLTKAADAGNADAQVTLGYYHLKGLMGVTVDEAKGMELFLKAAKQGHRDSQYNVGLAYARGQGVTQDYEEALHWFTKAGEQDDPGAQYNLGLMYLLGEGAVKDPLTAYAWFSLAEEKAYEGAGEAKNDARAEMNSAQVKEADAVLARVRARIRRPAAQQGTVNQPL